jgi:hypothetical protein
VTSRNLSAGQLRGLLKVGDVLIPGDGELPSFSESGAAEHADRMLDYMHEGDRSGVKLLLGLCRFLPRLLIRGLLRLTERPPAAPAALGAALRTIGIGIKGPVMTLYYSDVAEGFAIHERLGYDPVVVVPPGGAED